MSSTSHPPLTIREHMDLTEKYSEHKVASLRSKFIVAWNSITDENLLVNIADPDNPRHLCGEDPLINHDGTLLAYVIKGQFMAIADISTKRILLRSKLRSIERWGWVSADLLYIVTRKTVFHWSVLKGGKPEKAFDIDPSLIGMEIIKYACNAQKQCGVLSTTVSGNFNTVFSTYQGFHAALRLQIWNSANNSTRIVLGLAPIFCHSINMNTHRPSEKSWLCYTALNKKIQGELYSNWLLDPEISGGEGTHVLHIEEVHSEGNIAKKSGTFSLTVYMEVLYDYVCNLAAVDKYGLVILLSCYGSVLVFEIETSSCVHRIQVCTDAVGREEQFYKMVGHGQNGFLAVNGVGKIYSVMVNHHTASTHFKYQGDEGLTQSSSDVEKDTKSERICPAKNCDKGKRKKKVRSRELEENGNNGSGISEHARVSCCRTSRDHVNPLDRNELSVIQNDDQLSLDTTTKIAVAKELTPANPDVENTTTKNIEAGNHKTADSTNNVSIDGKKSKSLEAWLNSEDSPICETSIMARSSSVENSSPKNVNFEYHSTTENKALDSSSANNAVTDLNPTECPPSMSLTAQNSLTNPSIEYVSKKEGGRTPNASSAMERERSTKKSCIICYERDCDTVLVPCGHLWFCFQCATDVHEKDHTCPACREKIDNVLRVYTLD